jgi:hypothetical protein
MPDLPISGLTTLGTQSAGDLFVVVELASGVTKKESRQNIVAGVVSNTAYGASWNGVVDVAPSKNAVYDKFEALDGLVVHLAGTETITGAKTFSSLATFDTILTGVGSTINKAIKIGGTGTGLFRQDSGGAILKWELNSVQTLWLGENLGTVAKTAFTAESTVTLSALTASTVPYLDASKNLVSSTVTPTELGYVSGVTSAIQTQLNARATTAGTLAQFAATTSLELKTLISDETGSGALVFADTPTLVTPVLGAATGTSIVLTSTVTAGSDADGTHILGRVKIGSVATDQAVFSHFDKFTGTSYAVLQQATGVTWVNSDTQVNFAFQGGTICSVANGGLTINGGKNIILSTTTGSKIGTGANQLIGIWNATPIVQPTTSVAAATFVANTSAIADDTATFDGYTIGQVVKALRNFGLLA